MGKQHTYVEMNKHVDPQGRLDAFIQATLDNAVEMDTKGATAEEKATAIAELRAASASGEIWKALHAK